MRRLIKAIALFVSLGFAVTARGDEPPTPPGAAQSTGAISHLFFDDLCTKHNVCARIKQHYSEVRPDESVLCTQVGMATNPTCIQHDTMSVGVDSASFAERPFAAVLVAALEADTMPRDLLAGVRQILTDRGSCALTKGDCLAFRWLVTTSLRPENRDTSAGAQPLGVDRHNTITAIGADSLLRSPDTVPPLDTTFALFGTTLEAIDLDEAWVLEHFAARFSGPNVKVDRVAVNGSLRQVKVTADTPDEFGEVVAAIGTNPDDISDRRKYLVIERFAMEKSGVLAWTQQVAREVPEVWKAFWFKKLQTDKLDDVADYLVTIYPRQQQPSEREKMRVYLRAMRYFDADLSPATRAKLAGTLDAAEKASTALASAARLVGKWKGTVVSSHVQDDPKHQMAHDQAASRIEFVLRNQTLVEINANPCKGCSAESVLNLTAHEDGTLVDQSNPDVETTTYVLAGDKLKIVSEMQGRYGTTSVGTYVRVR